MRIWHFYLKMSKWGIQTYWKSLFILFFLQSRTNRKQIHEQHQFQQKKHFPASIAPTYAHTKSSESRSCYSVWDIFSFCHFCMNDCVCDFFFLLYSGIIIRNSLHLHALWPLQSGLQRAGMWFRATAAHTQCLWFTGICAEQNLQGWLAQPAWLSLVAVTSTSTT